MGFRTIAEVIGALGLLVLGGVVLNLEKGYICTDNKIAMPCDKLSQYYGLSNGKCWNSELGNKLCRSGWERLDTMVEAEPDKNVVSLSANGKSWSCLTDNGKIGSYTKCTSNKGTQGYLGELV